MGADLYDSESEETDVGEPEEIPGEELIATSTHASQAPVRAAGSALAAVNVLRPPSGMQMQRKRSSDSSQAELCSRSATCGCPECLATWSSLGRPRLAPMPEPPRPLPRRVEVSSGANLPDVVLLQASTHLGPSEVCAMAATCSSWADAIATSEAWLWSAVASAGDIPQEITALLEAWATAAGVPLRQALQLWLCRAYLWGAEDGPLGPSPVSLVTADPLSSMKGSTTVCCTAWRPSEAAPCEVAIASADHRLAFGRVVLGTDDRAGLRRPPATFGFQGPSVPAAHGRNLVTAVQGQCHGFGASVFSSGLDGLVRVWDPQSGSEVHQMVVEPERGLNTVAASSLDAKLLCCGDAGSAFVLRPEAAPGELPLATLRGHSAAAYTATWVSAATCATGGFDRRALYWDIRSPHRPSISLGVRAHVYALAAQGSELLVGQGDGAIARWDLRAAREPAAELRGHRGAVESLALLPGGVLASVGAEGQLRIWDARGQPTFQWSSPGCGPITCLAPVAEDGLLVAGQGLHPSLLSLNYNKALDRLPEAFARMSLARRRPSESLEGAGPGRHTDLRRRQPRPSRQPEVEVGEFRESRGAFDRCRKPKAVPLGSSGSMHRSLLCGLRR